jgi:fyn-related kinase
MMSFNQFGSFLIRESETKAGDYSLSLRDRERVRHYRIYHLEDNIFFITRKNTFKTIRDLVAYYKCQPDVLCGNLMYPCLLSEKPQTVNEEWEIDHRQIRLIKKLGGGQFSEEWEGLWNKTTPVTVKALKPGTTSAAKFLQQAELMKRLRHRNIIQLYTVCTREPIYIITEFMDLGSLQEYLHGEGRSLRLPELIGMCTQIAEGMAYLESQNCIHHDLTAKNILVSHDMICKVANFGIANKYIYKAHSTKFPLMWTAPEAAMQSQFTVKSDVWCFGIVLYEVITYGRLPYPGMNNAQVLEALQQGYRMPCAMGCPEKLYEIMLDCWREEPANRPTFETLQWQLEEFFTADYRCYREPEQSAS